MRPLIIDEEAKANVAAAVAWARENMVPRAFFETNPFGGANIKDGVLNLADRPDIVGERQAPRPVEFVHGFTACFSIEDQPHHKVKHLSVSVDTPGMSPNPVALEMIADLYGMPRSKWLAVWAEEFMPGHHAVNVLTECKGDNT